MVELGQIHQKRGMPPKLSQPQLVLADVTQGIAGLATWVANVLFVHKDGMWSRNSIKLFSIVNAFADDSIAGK